MNECGFCGRKAEESTKIVEGYRILECCSDCEKEIRNTPYSQEIDNFINDNWGTDDSERIHSIRRMIKDDDFDRIKALIDKMKEDNLI